MERPQLRRLFTGAPTGKLILEPARIALAAALILATFCLVLFFVRGAVGQPVPPMTVVVGVGLTFVVSYTAVGILVVYLLWVGERELPEIEEIEPPEEEPVETGAAPEPAPAEEPPGQP